MILQKIYKYFELPFYMGIINHNVLVVLFTRIMKKMKMTEKASKKLLFSSFFNLLIEFGIK